MISRKHPRRRWAVRQHVLLAAGLLAALLMQSGAALAAEPKTLEQLESAYTQEKDQRKRARLALDILDLRLNAIRAFIATETMIEPNNPVLPPYDAALSRLDEAVHAAAHAGTSKRVEMGLRRHMKDLAQIRIAVSSSEVPLVEALAARVEKLREAVLYSIMAPKQKK